MRRQPRFAHAARYRRSNDRRAVFVADIVLYDKYGSDSALLRADDRRQIGEKYISSFYSHNIHSPLFSFSAQTGARLLLFFTASRIFNHRAEHILRFYFSFILCAPPQSGECVISAR